MSERAQLDHVLLDVGFFVDDKIVELEEEYGELAQLFLVKVLAMMSAATNGEISFAAARGVRGRTIEKDKAQEILEFCVKRGILSQTTEGLLTNSRVQKDQESLAKQRKKWRESKGITPQLPPNIPPRIPPRNTSDSVNTEQLNTEDLNLDPKKLSDPPDTQPHHVRLAEFVEISEIDFPVCVAEFERNGLIPGKRWLERAAVHLAPDLKDHPQKRHKAAMLILKWPLQECLKELRLQNQAETSGAYRDKAASQTRTHRQSAQDAQRESIEELAALYGGNQ